MRGESRGPIPPSSPVVRSSSGSGPPQSTRLADATLACARCDAPVAIGPGRLTLGAELTCPFCGHQAPVRDFVSLALPTRATRVVVRVGFVSER